MSAASIARWGPDDGRCPKCSRACGPTDRYDGYRQCKSCVIAAETARVRSMQGERLERRRESQRFAQIKSKYGLTRQRYDEMLARQGGLCAVCQQVAKLCVDHDHRCCSGTGSCGGCVRGLVCSPCNQMLGWARDNPAVLDAAADYLRTRSEIQPLGARE